MTYCQCLLFILQCVENLRWRNGTIENPRIQLNLQSGLRTTTFILQQCNALFSRLFQNHNHPCGHEVGIRWSSATFSERGKLSISKEPSTNFLHWNRLPLEAGPAGLLSCQTTFSENIDNIFRKYATSANIFRNPINIFRNTVNIFRK